MTFLLIPLAGLMLGLLIVEPLPPSRYIQYLRRLSDDDYAQHLKDMGKE